MVLFVSVGFVYAQFGKVSGTVIDKQSKEPLIGATISVLGTTLGAATDVDGRYVVLNVNPGVYDVKTTYIGYQEVTVRNVRVSAGLTEEINFTLATSAVEVNPVEIIAERPLVEKSATNAVRVISAEDLLNLPVRGTQAAFALQPGVVLQNDRIFIRGSRPSEVGYQVEGADVKNMVGGRRVGAGGFGVTNDESAGSIVSTIPEAVEEIQVQAGGYNAEFGGSNAGIIQQSLKTGREQYHWMLQSETDNFTGAGTNPGKEFLGTYSTGYSDHVLSLSGPTINDKIRFYIAGENRFVRDYTPVFWTGANFGYMTDNGTRGGNAGDSAQVGWSDGNITGRSMNTYSYNGTLLFDYKPLLIKLSGVGLWQRTRANGLSQTTDIPSFIPVQEIFDQSRLPQVDQSNILLTARGTYFFNANTFAELGLSFVDQRTEQYDPNFDDSNILLYGDSIAAAARGWSYSNYATVPQPYDFYGFPFDRAGTPLANFTKFRQNNYTGSLSLTSQMGRHEVKAGVSYEYLTVRNYAGMGGGVVIPDLLTAMRAQPDVARDATQLATLIRKESFMNNYGFDEFGNPVDSGPDGPKHPKFISAYLQDKIEFSDLIVNAGLRFDYLDMDTWAVQDPNNPGFDPTNFTITPSYILKGSTFSYVEPRLGFSFPVSDRTVFHLQYGSFVQSPELYTAYRGRASASNIFVGQHYITNPIAFDIEPVRTTQYELGFTQQFTDFASFDVTGFYKDIKGQLQDDLFVVSSGASVQNYHIYTNSDFTTTEGVEFRITLRRVSRLQAQLNYTLSSAVGTNSFPSSANAAIEITQGGVKPTAVTPMSYNQASRGSINVDYRFGVNDGGPILERAGVNLLFTFNSGHPFTLATGSGGQQGPETGALLNDGDARSRQPLEPINNSTTPWNFDLDMRVDKAVAVAGLNLDIYVYVQNLLNAQNVVNVYYRTGNAFDDGYLTNPSLSGKVVQGLGANYVDLYNVINLQDRQHQWNLNGVDLFSTPRQIRLGARVEF